MPSNLDQVLQRTRQYWFVDGLAEIVLGGLFLILGLFFYAQVYFGENSLLSNLLQSGFALIFIGAFLTGRRLIAILKARITYPRTGYVAYQQSGRKNNLLSAGFAILVAAIVALMFKTAPDSLDWMPAITGALGGLIFFIAANQLNVLRFYALSLISLAIGVGLSVAGLGNLRGLAGYYALMGLVIFFSGLLTLFSYLRDNQALPAED
jgi:hypothetical protein